MEIKARKLDDCINTYSGLKINLVNPKPEMIDPRDIAKGLAYKAHFGGQTPFYFSIAQHSTLVVKLMQEAGETDYDMLLLGLLHDASEAYIGDMVKPLKVHLPEFVKYEDRLMEVICEKYNLDYNRLPEIKPYDLIAFELEYETFFGGNERVSGLDPDESLREFSKLFDYLYFKMNDLYAD
jgi:hypothetical protein